MASHGFVHVFFRIIWAPEKLINAHFGSIRYDSLRDFMIVRIMSDGCHWFSIFSWIAYITAILLCEYVIKWRCFHVCFVHSQSETEAINANSLNQRKHTHISWIDFKWLTMAIQFDVKSIIGNITDGPCLAIYVAVPRALFVFMKWIGAHSAFATSTHGAIDVVGIANW